MHFGLPGDRLYQLAQARLHNVLHFLVNSCTYTRVHVVVNYFFLYISSMLPHSKHCTTELPLTTGLTHTYSCNRYSRIDQACMSPTLNGNSALQRIKCTRNRQFIVTYCCTILSTALSLEAVHQAAHCEDNAVFVRGHNLLGTELHKSV